MYKYVRMSSCLNSRSLLILDLAIHWRRKAWETIVQITDQLCTMLITLPSIKKLAFIAVFARNAAAQANSTMGVIAATPAPSATPDFQYQFKIDFSGGKCTQNQQRYIEAALKNIGALAYRGGLWQTTPFRDWTPEVNYWFGNLADTQAAWIKSIALLNYNFYFRSTC